MKKLKHTTPGSKKTAGFTIIELLIATMVFGVILLVVAVGVVRFANDYYKGITSSRTQATTRAVLNQISQSLQLSKTFTVLPRSGNTLGFCVDNMLYTYMPGQQVTDTRPAGGFAIWQGYHGLLATNYGPCPSAIPASIHSYFEPGGGTSGAPASTRELLGQHMRLAALDIQQNGKLFTIRVKVIYGDFDLLTPTVIGGTNWITNGALENCAGKTGDQFCAVSDLTTTVEQRLN